MSIGSLNPYIFDHDVDVFLQGKGTIDFPLDTADGNLRGAF